MTAPKYPEMDLVPSIEPLNKPTFKERLAGYKRYWTTKEGWIGDYDYMFLITPNLPFMKKRDRRAPFYGLHSNLPIVLALILGFQHALAMLAGIVTPPLILGGSAGANLDQATQQYLISASLIVCGILSSVQITRFHLFNSPYYIGTGLISVVGTSFATIPVATGAFAQWYANGTCPVDASGARLPCPHGYGAILGTACVCSLLEIALSFMPPKALKKAFPPLVTGPVVLLIGVNLVASGFEDWAGGSGNCFNRPTTGDFQLCPSNTGKHALPWGSPQFIGLGFSVWVTIIIVERFGSPLMKSCAVVLGLVVGIIISAATGYFDDGPIQAAPSVTFIWVRTFKLSVSGPIVLPFLAVFLILMMEAIGDITATCDVSRVEVDGLLYDSRIQGGILADGLNGMLAGLCTITPMSTFAQNNGVISLTRCANRKAGYCCCLFLFLMGIFSKFAAVFVAIPSAVLGGMTTFLFTAVAVSGVRILATCEFSRRNRFIMTCALSVGFGAILVPDWFSYFFSYSGPNKALAGFLDAITLLMEAGYALAGVISLILHLMLPEESEKGELMTEGKAPAIEADDRDIEGGITTNDDIGPVKQNSLDFKESKIEDPGSSKME